MFYIVKLLGNKELFLFIEGYIYKDLKAEY